MAGFNRPKTFSSSFFPIFPLSEAFLWRVGVGRQIWTGILFQGKSSSSCAPSCHAPAQINCAHEGLQFAERRRSAFGYQNLERLSLMSSDTVQQPIWERPKIPRECPAPFPVDRRPVSMTDVTARSPNLRVLEYRNATFAWDGEGRISRFQTNPNKHATIEYQRALGARYNPISQRLHQ
ncbi:hypothetical protein BKA70DRAFT_834278 [Coprinopsis sp. MPI-PUGE-AT-0042]|nr:hypothetical protein BKA70DRAFT_834278 [Coprinopsis sp. MPI-PUGE-AT-0042]